MRSLSQRVEFLANLAVIFVTILGAGLLLVRYFSPATLRIGGPAPRMEVVPHAGEVLPLEGVQWGERRVTVVLVLSATCQHCSDSAPFYKRLASLSTNQGFGLIALFPQSEPEAHRYLHEIGLAVRCLAGVSPPKVGARGTPTLIVANRDGIIEKAWAGRLSAVQEAEVTSFITLMSGLK